MHYPQPDRAYFAAIGIQKGKPFAPDALMQKILAEAAAVGKALDGGKTCRPTQVWYDEG